MLKFEKKLIIAFAFRELVAIGRNSQQIRIHLISWSNCSHDIPTLLCSCSLEFARRLRCVLLLLMYVLFVLQTSLNLRILLALCGTSTHIISSIIGLHVFLFLSAYIYHIIYIYFVFLFVPSHVPMLIRQSFNLRMCMQTSIYTILYTIYSEWYAFGSNTRYHSGISADNRDRNKDVHTHSGIILWYVIKY